jgi:hypothetical protein
MTVKDKYIILYDGRLLPQTPSLEEVSVEDYKHRGDKEILSFICQRDQKLIFLLAYSSRQH